MKLQKISINAGFTCPNRDGSVGRGGCAYCNNQSFTPAYCRPSLSVSEQLEEGIRFFSRKYPDMRYLAYFQSYSNTYGPTDHCMALYEEALRVPGVVGLVIATRPDCVSDALLDHLAGLSARLADEHADLRNITVASSVTDPTRSLPYAPVTIEFGVESANDDTLRRINRGHTWAQSADAIRRTARYGLRTGAHTILGLPGDDREALMQQARLIGQLPIDTLKLHQLQIIKGTRLAREYEAQPWPLPSVDEYIDIVCDYLALLPPHIVVERFVSSAPADMLIAPHWGLKNHEFVDKLRGRIAKNPLSQQ